MTHKTSRSRKHQFKKALLVADFGEIICDKRAFGSLVSLMFDSDILVQWRAVDALGQVAAHQAKTGLEPVREILRRLFWAMNDESGGFIWKAPEAAASVLNAVPELVHEYASILLSHNDLPCFKSGVYYASWLIATICPDEIKTWADDLAKGLKSKKPEDCAYVATALKLTDLELYKTKYEIITEDQNLSEDQNLFSHYDYKTRQILEISVSEFIIKFGEKLCIKN